MALPKLPSLPKDETEIKEKTGGLTGLPSLTSINNKPKALSEPIVIKETLIEDEEPIGENLNDDNFTIEKVDDIDSPEGESFTFANTEETLIEDEEPTDEDFDEATEEFIPPKGMGFLNIEGPTDEPENIPERPQLLPTQDEFSADEKVGAFFDNLKQKFKREVPKESKPKGDKSKLIKLIKPIVIVVIIAVVVFLAYSMFAKGKEEVASDDVVIVDTDSVLVESENYKLSFANEKLDNQELTVTVKNVGDISSDAYIEAEVYKDRLFGKDVVSVCNSEIFALEVDEERDISFSCDNRLLEKLDINYEINETP